MNKKYPTRKNVRLPKHNYSNPGAYFITICTHNRRNILSRIVSGIHESPIVKLTEYGNIVEDIINKLPDPLCVTIDKYVIMPNHVHIIFSITHSDMERAIHESPLRSKSLISSAVGYIKMNSSKEIHQRCEKITVWQRSFHDHIIRNEHDYYEIYKYIEENPLKWEKDSLYSLE